MILVFGTLLVAFILSIQVAYTQVPGARYASYAYQKTTAFNPTEFRNRMGVLVVNYSDITDTDGIQAIPQFAMGSNSEQYQESRKITYDATAKNASSISYSLDSESEKNGNTINPSTGEVTYAAGWSGITTITATATTSNGRTFSSVHTVTIHPLPIALASGDETISCHGTAIISGATAEHGSISWTHNGKGVISAINTLHPVY